MGENDSLRWSILCNHFSTIKSRILRKTRLGTLRRLPSGHIPFHTGSPLYARHINTLLRNIISSSMCHRDDLLMEPVVHNVRGSKTKTYPQQKNVSTAALLNTHTRTRTTDNAHQLVNGYHTLLLPLPPTPPKPHTHKIHTRKINISSHHDRAKVRLRRVRVERNSSGFYPTARRECDMDARRRSGLVQVVCN